MTTDQIRIDIINRAATKLESLLDDNSPARDDDDDFYMTLRNTMISLNDPIDALDDDCDATLHELLNILLDSPFGHRERITDLALSLSLCPMHFIDYAICFDDANDECDAIRLIHPSHDT